MATPTISDFLVVPINGTDLIAFFRGSNISRPLYLRYSTFLDILSQSIGGGTTLLLQTNSVDNPSQTLLNLIQGSGITINDNGSGGITIAATGGASFITSITDTADIDLNVALSDLTATLTTTGVTANTYGTATQVPQITVDSKGRITGVTLVNITAGTGTVTNVAVTNGTGISASVTNPTTTPNITITNTLPDQTVVLNNGTGIAVTGTYPNFTIANTAPSSGGTITGVTATSPITSSGGTNPNISTSMATNKLIGRGAAGTGVMEEITLGTNLSLSGTTLNASGGGVSPLTTKGDLYTYSTLDTRLPVGLNTQVLLADSTTATGLKWGTNTTPPALGYYGAFSDVTDQTAAVINTGYPMLLGVTDLSNGVTVVSGSRVTIANTGIYNIQWSGQFRNPLAAEHDVTIWLRKNGVDVPGSAGVVLVPRKHGSSDGHTLPSWNFLLDVVAGDYYEFVWSTDNISVFLSFEPAGSPPPSTASVVLTVTQQAGILAGTGITGLGTTGNIQTGATQTLATGTSGTAFGIVSSGNTQTFNIPLASTASVTAGLISNTNFNTFNGKQNALTATKSVEINTGNVELDGDETSPTARKFYSTSAAAARGWRAIEKADLPTIVSIGSVPYIQNEFISSNGGSAIIKIPGSNVIFAAYTTSATVVAYDTSTSTILSTTAVVAVVGLVYVASTGQVWAFGSAASVTRFTATTGVSLGITLVTLLTPSCRGVYDDSSVTGYVFAYNGGTMNRIDVTTYARTALTISATATGSFELVLVTSGLQSGLLVGTTNIGVFGVNKSAYTLAYAPTTAPLSQSIKYIPSLNKILTLSGGNNSIYVYTPATATTITLSSTIAGVFSPYYIEFDETENFIFVISGYSGTFNLKLSVFDLTTLLMVKSMPLTAITSNSVGYIAIDKTNKALYITGVTNGGSINKVIYA